MRRDRDEREERPDADLRERLHGMEAKVRKLREIRNQHSDKARRSRDQRNAVQAQYKEHRETVDLLIAEVKAIRAEVNLHRERRNAIQDQLKQFIAQIKGRRGDKDAKRSATAEYHQLKAEMERLEETFETSSVGMKKEKEMMDKLKRMGNRVGELAPDVEEFELVKVDLKDLDGSIKMLKAEADSEHQLFIEAIKRADEVSSKIDEAFAHRDFLKAEGDRHHLEHLDHRKEADAVHAQIEEMMADVNKVRDELKMAREERESWVTDHNASVRAEMQTGAQSETVADELVNALLKDGNLTFGGTMAEDGARKDHRGGDGRKKRNMRRIDMSSRRRR